MLFGFILSKNLKFAGDRQLITNFLNLESETLKNVIPYTGLCLAKLFLPFIIAVGGGSGNIVIIIIIIILTLWIDKFRSRYNVEVDTTL